MTSVSPCLPPPYGLTRLTHADDGTVAGGRVRPQLMENNLCDCIRIGEAAFKSLQDGGPVDISYYDY